MSEAGQAPRHLRRACLRAALMGGIFLSVLCVFCIFFLVFLDERIPLSAWALSAGVALVLGLVAAPSVAIEAIAEERPPSGRRDLAVFFSASLVALVGLTAISAQVAYAVGVHEHHTLEGGFTEVRRFFRDFHPTRNPILPTLLLLAAPFPVASVARVRRLSIGGQALATVVGGFVLGAFSIYEWVSHTDARFAAGLVPISALFFALVPVGLAGADDLEARLARRLFDAPLH